MPSTTIWIGRILVLIGIIGYGYGYFVTENPSVTALIPAVFGALLMLLGHLALAREGMAKHLMHAAVIVGLTGFAIPLVRLISGLGSGKPFGFASFMLLAMAFVCFLHFALSIRSFISARRGE
jgi:hypothetical protein